LFRLSGISGVGLLATTHVMAYHLLLRKQAAPSYQQSGSQSLHTQADGR
jgi:hypothetical protein